MLGRLGVLVVVVAALGCGGGGGVSDAGVSDAGACQGHQSCTRWVALPCPG